jgi:RND family efflux transporter MFP subunit
VKAVLSRSEAVGAKASFAIAGLIAISALCGCDAQKKDVLAGQPARPVKIMTVGSACDAPFREYPAKVKANKRVKLAFQVGGQIVSFPIKAGDRLKAGDVIGELDRRDYENACKSSLAKYKDSKSDFERQAKLVGRSIVAISTFESKQMECEVAEAAMKTAAKALEDATLKAPFDGVVVGTYVDNYQNVKAQEPVVSLQDIGSVELVINVPEKDVARASAGLTLDAMNGSGAFTAVFPTLDGKEFPLKIKEYESEADASAQTFKVVMVMEAPKDVNVMPG